MKTCKNGRKRVNTVKNVYTRIKTCKHGQKCVKIDEKVEKTGENV
jgi:uncharacterized Fe-S cluster protein YjdI